jgi:hypothetical protein
LLGRAAQQFPERAKKTVGSTLADRDGAGGFAGESLADGLSRCYLTLPCTIACRTATVKQPHSTATAGTAPPGTGWPENQWRQRPGPLSPARRRSLPPRTPHLMPKTAVTDLPVGMDVDGFKLDLEALEDAAPHLAGDAVVRAAEGEVAKHPEGGQVGAVADQAEVVGADAALEGAVNRAGRGGETVADALHARADEQGGGLLYKGQIESRIPGRPRPGPRLPPGQHAAGGPGGAAGPRRHRLDELPGGAGGDRVPRVEAGVAFLRRFIG